MPIEFRCPQCDQLLRVPDDTAGKQARCPECGAVASVPSPRPGVTDETLPYDAGPTPPPAPGGAPPDSPPAAAGQPPGYDPANPYASPGEYVAGPSAHATKPGEITPTRIDMEDIFHRTWAIFKVEWGTCLVAMIIVVAISIAVNIVAAVAVYVPAMLIGDRGFALILEFFGNVITTLFDIWLGIGLNLYFLKVARGQRVEFNEIFRGGPYFFSILGATILFSLACALGTLACFIPGIILALMLSQYYYLILDRNVGAMDSLTISQRITSGNKLMLLGIWLVATMGGILLTVCTCLLGLLAIMPFLGLMTPVIYLTMTGQPTADQLHGESTTP